ncbi:MAG: quinolinate synthase NadA [Planctomycetota bacterium]|nr:MAG: quinolinate synthase NadA [Planctomycetota bacterium]
MPANSTRKRLRPMLYQLPLPPRYAELSEDELDEGIRRFKAQLGDRLVILCHHYQQDDVYRYADFTGDSLKLSQLAAEQTQAEFIVFCGVHFMAESADILTSEAQRVILPDLSAGCSMADMAHIDQLEEAWPLLLEHAGTEIVPITYVNSSAAVKAFVGRHGGACCTSSNARQVLEWALDGATPDDDVRGGRKVLFLPDQHLGRNTAHALGWPLETMVLYDPQAVDGGLEPEDIAEARFFLWKGHCSVHQLFNAAQVEALRADDRPWTVLVHPECSWEVCQRADLVGSTEFIIKTVREAPPESYWAIGTEVHLVQRLADQHPDKHIRSLASIQCLCTTMYRIDPKHLYWALERLARGEIVNRIVVDDETKHWARVALDGMLQHAPPSPVGVK